MTMRKTFGVLLVVVTLLATMATSAQAVEFLYHAHLNPGESKYGPTTNVYQVDGGSYGVAAVCVGVTGYGDVCGSEGQFIGLETYGAYGRPYVHDHSTWETYVDGYYY
jgi:hypothetical protein